MELAFLHFHIQLFLDEAKRDVVNMKRMISIMIGGRLKFHPHGSRQIYLDHL